MEPRHAVSPSHCRSSGQPPVLVEEAVAIPTEDDQVAVFLVAESFIGPMVNVQDGVACGRVADLASPLRPVQGGFTSRLPFTGLQVLLVGGIARLDSDLTVGHDVGTCSFGA